VSGAGQNYCSLIAKSYVPAIVTYYVSEILLSLMGVVMFFSFGVNQEVFDFWRQILQGNFSRVVEIPQMNGPSAFSYQAGGERAKSLRRCLLARQMMINLICLSYHEY